MAHLQSESQPGYHIIYYPPSRETITRLVQAFCIDFEAGGETAVNTEEIRSGLAEILEIVAAVCVSQINDKLAWDTSIRFKQHSGVRLRRVERRDRVEGDGQGE